MPVRYFSCCGAVDGIELRHVLVADHLLAVLLEAHLPERGVADEERRVPAGRDEVVDHVALLPRPVLVVAGRRQHAVPVHHAGVAVEVPLDAVVQRVAVGLQPRHEDRLPRVEAGEARPVVVALLDVARERVDQRALAEARRARVGVADGARRPAEEAPLPRPLERQPARDRAGRRSRRGTCRPRCCRRRRCWWTGSSGSAPRASGPAPARRRSGPTRGARPSGPRPGASPRSSRTASPSGSGRRSRPASRSPGRTPRPASGGARPGCRSASTPPRAGRRPARSRSSTADAEVEVWNRTSSPGR